MNFDEQQALTYGQNMAGWRLDCLGDMRTNSEHEYFPAEMLEVYPSRWCAPAFRTLAAQSGLAGDLLHGAGWKEKGYDLDYILEQALRWHVSSVNIKSAPIPSEWKSQFESFQKKMDTVLFCGDWNIQRRSTPAR